MIFRCDNSLAIDRAIACVRSTFAKSGFAEISITGQRRTFRQQSTYWPWCRQIAQARDDGTSEYDVDGEVKLERGFSIRRASDAEFDELLSKTIDKLWPEADRWDLAHALAMEMQCTSKLSAADMSDLLEYMQLHYWQTMQIRLEAK